jgi:hypothetical protein
MDGKGSSESCTPLHAEVIIGRVKAPHGTKISLLRPTFFEVSFLKF